jgi:hypothetical protein
MSLVELRLRAATTAPIACKICDGPSALYGVADLNRPCDIGHKAPALSGVPIYYRRCAACGFLFTDAFDDWEISEFKTHIYNDEYLAYDPEYETKRPSNNATWVTCSQGKRQAPGLWRRQRRLVHHLACQRLQGSHHLRSDGTGTCASADWQVRSDHVFRDAGALAQSDRRNRQNSRIRRRSRRGALFDIDPTR